MHVESLARALSDHSFCKKLSKDQIEFMSSCVKNSRFAPGEYLVTEGSGADILFLIRDGRVALESHLPGKGAIQVDTLALGDVLGWSVLLPPFVWHLDARAVEPTLAFAVDGNCLRGKVNADKNFGYALTLRLLDEVSNRLNQARLQQLDVYKAELRR